MYCTCGRPEQILSQVRVWIKTLRTYGSSPHVGRMRKVHIVEQEKDGVQSVVLLRLTFFPCPVTEKT